MKSIVAAVAAATLAVAPATAQTIAQSGAQPGLQPGVQVLPPPAATQQLPQPGKPAAPVPEQWQPRGGFELRALDKVNARPLTITGRVGQPVQYGSLTITGRSCVVRPPDEPADAAVFLEIVDQRPGVLPFHGWIFANEPALDMFEHPLYDIRLTGCRP